MEFSLEKVVSSKQTFLPPKIYRYRPITLRCSENSHCALGSNFERELRNLDQDLIWLSNPENYNDPFDSLASFPDSVFSEFLKEEMVARFSETLKKPLTSSQIENIITSPQGLKELIRISANEHGELNEQERNEAVQELEAFYDRRYAEHLSLFQEIIRKSALVCSFSERFDSTVMWSHYAKDHKGFCIEYTLQDLNIDDQISQALFPVIYTEGLLNVTEQLRQKEGDKRGIAFAACISKSKDWEYEREWRLIFLFRPPALSREMIMPKPTKILLGAKIEKQHQEQILRIAKKKHIPVFRMKISHNDYKMIEEQVQY